MDSFRSRKDLSSLSVSPWWWRWRKVFKRSRYGVMCRQNLDTTSNHQGGAIWRSSISIARTAVPVYRLLDVWITVPGHPCIYHKDVQFVLFHSEPILGVKVAVRCDYVSPRQDFNTLTMPFVQIFLSFPVLQMTSTLKPVCTDSTSS